MLGNDQQSSGQFRKRTTMGFDRPALAGLPGRFERNAAQDREAAELSLRDRPARREEAAHQRGRAEAWDEAARALYLALLTGTAPSICPRCKRPVLTPRALAEQAGVLRAAIALDLVRPGGAEGDENGLRAALDRAEELALEHSRAAACLAGICAIPAANEQDR
jgi:hypothetical protein